MPVVQRAKPLLGTIVKIRADGPDVEQTHRAVDGAFAEIARIHDLMSFHETASDLTRINRNAASGPVRVHEDTMAVLAQAQDIAAASDGAFDVTIGAALVAWGYLPRMAGGELDPAASWRDVILVAPDQVQFARPLLIDLGGIAKGYAVDRAMAHLRACGVTQACVNAGGDLRIFGPESERVLLDVPDHPRDSLPVVELQDGSIASSSGRPNVRSHGSRQVGPHVDRATGEAVGLATFAAVVAADCITADALTKVVLVREAAAVDVLRRLEATAYLYARGAWQILGAAELAAVP